MGGVSANPSEPEPADGPFLLFRDRDGRQQVFYFAAESAHATVGREASSDLVLDWDEQVSRVHARFQRVGDDWEVVDDGLSSNGTFVNDERVSDKRLLTDGDVLRFGTTTATFRSPGRERKLAVPLSTTQRRVLEALCDPYKGRSGFANPATDEQIAEQLFLSAGEVRAHLKVLYVKLGVEELPATEKRVRLVERAFSAGLISERDR
jgi:pSer/pThr/pTyr-binding forkhead associated (FHA) protein